MNKAITPKIVLLSALYLIVAIIFIVLLDFGLEWLLANVIFSVLDWFNGLSYFWEILIIFLGGSSLFWGLLEITGKLSTLLGGLFFNKLPQNNFTAIAPFILANANAIWYIIILWKIPEHYGFWIVCELIFLSVFIWQLSAIVIPAKEQIKIFSDDRNY